MLSVERILSMTQQIPGSLNVSNDVLVDLVGNAALGCYGIVGMALPSLQDGIASLLPNNRLRRGISVRNGDNGVDIDLYVVVEYGTNIAAVSKNLIDNVKYVLSDQAQIPVNNVMVHVQGIKVRR